MNRDIVNQSIKDLYQRSFWFYGLDKKLEALENISRYGELCDIRYAFHFVYDEQKLSQKAAGVVCTLLSKIKPKEWICLYDIVKYENLHKNIIKELRSQFPVEEAICLLGLASLNESGYVRQEALRELAKFQSGKVVPFILLRLADWVKPVKDEATAILNQYLAPEYALCFWEYCFLFDWMERVQRVDLRSILDSIFEYLSANLSKMNCGDQWFKQNRSKKVFYYKVLLRNKDRHNDLFELIRKDRDPSIRFWYVKNILVKNRIECTEQVNEFLRDSSSRIKTYLLSDSTLFGLLPLEYVKEKLYDNSSLVREIARYGLKKNGFEDFVSICRKAILDQKSIKPGYLLGLAETGDMSDYHTIEQYVAHSNSRNRRAAILGLSYLNHESSVSYLMMGLNDKAGKVREGCSTALKKNMDENIIESLRFNINGMTIDGKITALELLCDKKSWESLTDILLLSMDENEAVSNKAWDELKFWIQKRNSKLWVKPEPELLLRIEKEIQKVHNMPNDRLQLWNELKSLIETGKKIWR